MKSNGTYTEIKSNLSVLIWFFIRTAVLGESGNSSPRSVSPVEYMDQENSEKELDDDDEETYETCDSGASDAGSISDTENHTSHSSIGFKRKWVNVESHYENTLKIYSSNKHRFDFRYENVEKRISESETNSDSTTNTTKYRSVISDVFDGRLLSSVQCLTCDRVLLSFCFRLWFSVLFFHIFFLS